MGKHTKKNDFLKFLGPCSFTDTAAPMLEFSHILCNIETIPVHDKNKLLQCNDVPQIRLISIFLETEPKRVWHSKVQIQKFSNFQQ